MFYVRSSRSYKQLSSGLGRQVTPPSSRLESTSVTNTVRNPSVLTLLTGFLSPRIPVLSREVLRALERKADIKARKASGPCISVFLAVAPRAQGGRSQPSNLA